MKKFVIVFLAICAIQSCVDKKDGDWEDNIKLSQKEFQFNSLANMVRINTGGESWWISELFFKDGQTFDLSEIDTTAKNFVISEPQFTLERKNGKELIIELKENTTGAERKLTIGLQNGNYFDAITINQLSE